MNRSMKLSGNSFFFCGVGGGWGGGGRVTEEIETLGEAPPPYDRLYTKDSQKFLSN